MTNQSKLVSIPADIQHHLLSLLPDFYDLGALILTSRCFHDIYKSHRRLLLDEVAKNFLGCIFDEAMLLARAQEAKYGLGDPSVKGLSSNTIFLIVNNDYIVRSLEDVVFGLMKADSTKFDIYDEESLARFASDPFTAEASPTESIRFQAAAYRFWRFCLCPAKKRTAFLNKFPSNELFEMSHFVTGGLTNLIYAMWRVPQESDHDWDFVSSVLSTGPENILNMWNALQRNDPEFEMELDGAGSNGEEGFFDYPLMKVMEVGKLDNVRGLGGLESIFDEDNKKMMEVLSAHETPTREAADSEEAEG
ncbi:hypothetical protein C8R44DRAFT_880638 [Mycena epipterygia]|nr:hypothetical protein C8R44DRAFT_880638 [Mycena epipterygia]